MLRWRSFFIGGRGEERKETSLWRQERQKRRETGRVIGGKAGREGGKDRQKEKWEVRRAL